MKTASAHPALLSTVRVDEINETLRHMYAVATEHLAASADADLAQRLRGYDNNQRLTFGRAQSQHLTAAYVKTEFGPSDLHQLDFNGPDPSFFPASDLRNEFAPLADVVRFCAQEILVDDSHDGDEVLVTAFLHRVLVRPQGEYVGFFHRDLAEREGRIGTVVLYPEVRYARIQGAELVAFTGNESLHTLSDREPDYVFSTSEYHNSALVLPYPHNFAHGVRPGVNPMPTRPSWTSTPREFLEPPSDAFIKEVAIFTLSNVSPVEQ